MRNTLLPIALCNATRSYEDAVVSLMIVGYVIPDALIQRKRTCAPSDFGAGLSLVRMGKGLKMLPSVDYDGN